MLEERGPFEFVLLDYHMPGMDGLELARRIRATASTATPRLIMLSSSDVRGEEGLEQLDGYAVKPILQNALYLLIGRTLGKTNAGGEAQFEPAPLSEPAAAPGYRVLLAEDNVVNQKVAIRMLEKLGCRVDVAANGSEAVAMWERLPYAIVFMDCQMPEMDGLEATRQIRQLEMIDEGHTPIVAMTANAMPKDQAECLAAGMDDYLAKPVKLVQMSDMLQRWCRDAAGIDIEDVDNSSRHADHQPPVPPTR